MVQAVRHYQRGKGHERESCTLSYMELTRMVKVYHSEHAGRMEREVSSFDAATVDDGRAIFGREHEQLIGAGWQCVATDVKTVGAIDGEGQPEPRR